MRRCRRGRPANHLEFGEAIAILAAFGLLNLAYGDARARVRAGAGGAHVATLIVGRGRARRADRRAGARSAGDRSADQLRDARAHPSRQDRRAVRRRRVVRRAHRRRRPRSRSPRSPRTPRTSGSRFRSSTTCSTSPAIRRRPARPCARTRARRRSCRSAACDGARQLAAELCETADRALGAVRRAGRPAARAVGVRRGEAPVSRASRQIAGDVRPARRRAAAAAAIARLPRRRRRSLRARRRRRARGDPPRSRCWPSLRIGLLSALLLGPAAAIGLGLRLPGLVSGAARRAGPGALSRRAVLPRRPRSVGRRQPAGVGVRSRR